jgi:dihydrodipicolinate synthase/N-acetylneuraminate lyase
MKPNLDGIAAILLTPFDETGSIDTESLHRLVKWYQVNDVSAIVVPAVASEVDKLSLLERAWIVVETISATQGETPVIGGVLGDNGDEAARLAESALKAGCCAVMCRAPERILGDVEKVYAYFATIASAGMESLVIQDLSFRGGGLDLALILRLFENIPAFRDIKVEVEMTNYKATQIIDATQGQLQVWSGWALLQMIEALDRGVRTFCPSVFHKPFVQISKAYFAGDRRTAMGMFDTILPYLAWSRQNSDINLQLLKHFCTELGLLTSNKMRAPVHPYDLHHEMYANELIQRMLVWQNNIEYPSRLE